MIKPDEIIRSRRRTLSISVDAFARLIVRAPIRCSEERIFTFLQEKEAWIVQKQAERRGAGIVLPPEDLNGYTFLLLGALREIRLTDTKKIALEEGKIFLPKDQPQKRLTAWLKSNAKRILTEETARIAAQMGVEYHSVTISSARSRWGSCSADNKIRYSFRLLYAPKEVVEYVVTHELAHIRYKNHSPAFWTEVAKYQPNYKAKRKWLKTHGALMYIF